MAHIGDGRLRKLFKEAEFDREHEEVKEIEKTVRKLVEEIAESIAEKDPLFKNSILLSGSFYEDLKVEGPNEFDFMICLEELSEPGVCEIKAIPFRDVPDPGYVHVGLKKPEFRNRWLKYLSKRTKNLSPKFLLKQFKRLVDRSLTEKRKDFPEKLEQWFETKLRNIPVTVKLIWSGNKYRRYDIDIDLVLCIRTSGWPNDSCLNNPSFNIAHPGYTVMKQATKTGYHLVASCIGESGKQRPCWRLSFSKAEGFLLKHICKNSTLVHKATVKILKVVRKKNEPDLCLFEHGEDIVDSILSGLPETSYLITWAFHSYVLKTMFLQEWFEFPEDSYWTQDKLAQRIGSILKRILDSLHKKDIRSFWLPDYKLFNFRARGRTHTKLCEEKLERLVNQFNKLGL